jgi:hypothetical protein
VAATALARTKTIELDEHQKNSLQFLLTAMNYIEEVNPLTTAFKRDLETEFPDLTASFSGLSVGSGIGKVSVKFCELFQVLANCIFANHFCRTNLLLI